MLTLILSLLVMPASAEAKGNVFCKTRAGVIMSALSEKGHYDCAESLRWGGACFTGKRAEVIEIINSDTFNWDEEWLENAHFMGRDSISYEFVDGPNELREKLSLDRCDSGFFGK